MLQQNLDVKVHMRSEEDKVHVLHTCRCICQTQYMFSSEKKIYKIPYQGTDDFDIKFITLLTVYFAKDKYGRVCSKVTSFWLALSFNLVQGSYLLLLDGKKLISIR